MAPQIPAYNPANARQEQTIIGMEYLLIALVIGLALLTWSVLSWHLQEDLSFKEIIQNAFRDAREIAEPFMRRVACTLTRWWAFLGPRITNLPTLAVVLLDVYATTTPEMRDLLASDHRLAASLLVLNLVARLSPRNAPLKIPGPSGMPGGGLTNPAATA